MTSPRALSAAAILLVALAPFSVSVAQQPASTPAARSAPRISGLMYGDYYWVARHHMELEDRSGFWARRVYLTIDQELSRAWSARMRFEANQPGDFKTNSKMEPFLKDLYVAYKRGMHRVAMGIVPTPTFELYEKFWGYRSVEKSPLDLYRWGASRDMGFGIQGALHKQVEYNLVMGNGSDTGTETDIGKGGALSIAFTPIKSVTLEAYGDLSGALEDVKRTTLQGALYTQFGKLRAGGIYARQRRESAGGVSDDVDVASLFATARLHSRVAGFLRADRQFQANGVGHKIPYLPIAEDAKADLLLGGLDLTVHETVHFMPNIEVVRYGRSADGVLRKADVMPRVTLFFQF